MADHNHNSQVLIKVANRQQHFGIRKLTVGAASVLLGTTLWLGGKANVVRADTQDDSANETPHEATQSSQSTPKINENTKVEVQVPTQNENISSTVNKVADSHTTSDLENQQQAAETNSTVENQLAKGTKQEEQNAQSINQILTRDDHQAFLGINEDNTNESAQKVTKTEKSKVQTDTTNIGKNAKSSNLDLLDLSTQKTSQNDFSTKQNNGLNLKKGSLSSKFNFNLKNLYGQSKIQSNNTDNGGFDKATWGTLDVNDWDTQDDGTYLELTGYKGDFNHIIVPNAADFEKAGLDTNDEEVGVTSTLMHNLFLKADSKNATVAFSKTNGDKVKAIDSDWSNVWGHDQDEIGKQEQVMLSGFDGSGLDTQNITNMSYMFENNQINDLSSLSKWDTSNITNMEGMFGENNLSDLSSLSSWDTVSVTNMSDMFVGNQISNLSPLKNWDTRSVTDMSDMFVGNQISDLKPLSNWNVGNVTDMSDMFSDNQISNLNSLSNWDISNVTDMHDMFETNKIGSLTGLENWDTGNVTNMDNMFSDNQISDLTPLTNWNTQNATSMINMFLLDPVTKADFSKWSFNNIEKFSDDLEDIAGDFSGLQNFIDPEDKVLINLGNNDSLPDWFLSKTVSNDEGENYSNDNIFTSNKGNHIILTSTQLLLANPNKAYNTLTFSNGDTATIPVFINARPTTALNIVKSLVDEKVAAEKNKLGNNYTVTIDPSVDQTDPIALANAKFNVALIKTGTVNVFVHDNTSNLNLTDYNWTSNVNGKPQNVGSNVNYNKEQTIADLTNHGYVVINPDVEVPSTVAEGTNNIIINVVHGTIAVNPDNPGRPGEPINPNDQNGPRTLATVVT